jgi:hypothetical protein
LWPGQKQAEAKREELRAKLVSGAEAQPAQTKAIAQLAKQSINLKLDAAVTAFFLSLVIGIFLISVREWILLLAREETLRAS